VSVKVSAVVWQAVLPAPQKLVLLCLAEHSNPDGKMSFPSVKRIVQETGLAERTVRRELSEMRKAGLIYVQARAGAHRPTRYGVSLAKISDLPQVQVSVEDLPDVQVRGATQAERPATQAERGATVAPEPSLTVSEPSEEPSEGERPRNRESIFSEFFGRASG
jgi:DNA-binding transcriptional ArsR family regulator